MNHVYNVVWNVSRQVWMAVGEISQSRGKSKRAVSQPAAITSPQKHLTLVASALALALSVGPVWAVVETTGDTNPSLSGPLTGSWNASVVDLIIGNNAVGTLAIDSGSTVSNKNGYIGQSLGGDGSVTVDGAGSSWTNSSGLFVGDNGTGSLSISNGGAVSNALGYIGRGSDSTGTVTVDGTGSSWDNSLSLWVGESGTGSLAISNGGAVSNATGFIGRFSGSNGSVTVDGVGSSWTTNSSDLYVGYAGTGSLTINNGGTVSSNLGFIGNNAGGNGTVTVDGTGSSWSNSNNLYVGRSGTGSLTIRNGGVVNNTIGIVGASGSTGSMSVDGAGSRWINRSNVFVGSSGNGSLSISNGAVVEANSGAGTLTIANQASATGTVNIGAAAGEAAEAAGTLNAASVVFGSGTGKLVFNHTEAAYEFAPTISGAGSVELHSGKTIFTGANTYSGGTSINAGTLQIGNGGTSGSISGDISNNGSLVFNRSDSVTYAEVISGTGSLTQSGAGSLTLIGANTYSGGTSINAGTLQIGNGGTSGSISGDINNNGSLVFNRTDSQTFAGDITGSGSISLASGSTRFSGGLSSYTGTLTVDAGTLSVADGDTLRLGGNYTQTSLGTLHIGVANDTTYGKLVVDGIATLPSNAQIDVDVSNPGFGFTTALTNGLAGVISAGTLISDGTFTVTDNSTLFNFDATKVGNQVNLSLKAVGGSGSTGLTEQIVVAKSNTAALGAARALDSIFVSDPNGPIATLFVPFTTDEQVNTAVSQTLPLLAGGSQVAATSALTGMNRVVQARIESNRGLSSGDYFYGDEKFWLKPFGSWADQDDRKGVSGYKSNTAGLAFGGDTTVSDATRLGLSFAYARSSVDGNSTLAPNSAKVDVYQLIGYGSHALDEATEINFQLGIGQNRNQGTRDLLSFGERATSSYDSLVATAGVGVGRNFTLSDTTMFTPSVRTDYSWIRDDGYTETGAGLLNLKVNSRTTDELILAMDGKLTQELKQDVLLSANLGLGYDLLHEQTSITSSFAGAPGAAFTTKGMDPSPWLARGGLGLATYTAGGMEISANYDAEYRQDFLNQTASIKLRWAF